MKRSSCLSLVAVSLFTLSSLAFAGSGSDDFNASRTFEFDPGHTHCVEAQWRNGIGEQDQNCQTNFGLHLEKNCPTSTDASAGAILNGLAGVVVQPGDVLGYDIKAGSTCGAGSPRFNVTYTLPDGTSGSSFVGGCSNGLEDAMPLGNGWTRIQFQLDDPTDAFPVIPPGSTIESVVLIVDEQGTYDLDNIRFRNMFAGKPGNSGPLPVCQ